MFMAENHHGHKTVAAQTKWADGKTRCLLYEWHEALPRVRSPRLSRMLAAEVAFKTWQTEMATTRAEMRTLTG